ncbi:cellulase family glycosylhydrolase [Oculatella sp. FACHB-28]|uniref:glycoside hydrolase family 5 protein n=1 Tax=Oculatella sp. FACHB-28 TaxID=2692845 RepID=UPI001687BB2F|nr:cellulase family glycosylhydrolase [Oculatella sp. FACHB-28]MBD2059606.1 cellulase family glycosylhydrolase [Oculatella sp. FACHB-28]
MKRKFWILFGVGLFAALFLSLLLMMRSLGVEQSRLERLTQGINVAHWFAQAELTADNFQNRIQPEDIQLIKQIGFRHIRLPLDPTILFDEEQPERLNSENLPYVDAALDQILAADLAVIVDLHPRSEFKRRLYQEESFVEAVGLFWRSLAQHLSSRNPNQVFLEVMNEPATRNPQDWYAIQERLLAEMRAGAPDHTLIASANLRVEDDWDTIVALQQITPVEDPNVVYNFHFYQPMSFTHQGADWGEDTWEHFRNVPYPADAEAIAAILPEIENETARDWLMDYGEEEWNAAKLKESLQRAAEWGQSHQVHVTCNEFGVYRRAAPVEGREAWLRDVRSLLEQSQIGWAMWEYDSGFGAIRRTDGERVPDPVVVKALFN